MIDQEFDPNEFKRLVKQWIRNHPVGSVADLCDYCEEQIPPAQYAAHKWLVEHTLSWYRHILAQRDGAGDYGYDADEAV